MIPTCVNPYYLFAKATERVVCGESIDGVLRRRVHYSVARSDRKMGGKDMLVKLNEAAGVQV